MSWYEMNLCQMLTETLVPPCHITFSRNKVECGIECSWTSCFNCCGGDANDCGLIISSTWLVPTPSHVLP